MQGTLLLLLLCLLLGVLWVSCCAPCHCCCACWGQPGLSQRLGLPGFIQAWRRPWAQGARFACWRRLVARLAAASTLLYVRWVLGGPVTKGALSPSPHCLCDDPTPCHHFLMLLVLLDRQPKRRGCRDLGSGHRGSCCRGQLRVCSTTEEGNLPSELMA